MKQNTDRSAAMTIFDILSWLAQAGLAGRSERGLTNGLAVRLRAAGVPVDRVSMGSDVLDPVLQARSFIWTPDNGAEKFTFERTSNRSDNWTKSTLYWMLSNEIHTLRLDLTSARAKEFSLMETLAAAGHKDYYGRIVPYGDKANLGSARGLMATFSTRKDGGFTDGDIILIDAILPFFALAFLTQSKSRMVSRVLSTYLGDTPAKRILKGDITRGEPQTIDAVLWMSDLSGFTKTSDPLPREAILEYLNAHAEIVANAIHAHGGEILKFIGDGILAVFDGRNGEACSAECALDAALEVGKAVEKLKETRMVKGLPTSNIIIALHQGNVLFGNFGSIDRLDFTALGSAVNEASRLVSLAKTLEQTLIVSQEFKDGMSERQDSLVSLGRYALRGVAGARHLYTADADMPILHTESTPPATVAPQP